MVIVVLKYSVVSAGGTRRVRRRRRNADGTYGTDEEYHSDESIAMRRAAKKKKKKKQHGSDSEYRYASSSMFISQIRKPHIPARYIFVPRLFYASLMDHSWYVLLQNNSLESCTPHIHIFEYNVKIFTFLHFILLNCTLHFKMRF